MFTPVRRVVSARVLHVVVAACALQLLSSTPAAAAALTATAPTDGLATRVGQQTTLSVARFNAFVVAGSGDLTKPFSLTVTSAEAGRDVGTVQLSTNAGLAGYDGGAAATITFTADSVASVNAGLDGLVFTPPAVNAAGSVTLALAHDGTTLASATCLVNDALDLAAARAALMSGVTGIDSGSSPGYVASFSEDAGSVIDFVGGGSTVAAASFGRGRVVLMGDHQMLSASTSASRASAGFINNALAWGTRSAAAAVPNLRIVSTQGDVTSYLNNAGFTNVVAVSPGSLTSAALADADVVMGWLESHESDVASLRAFTAEGGFLFAADYGIGYDWWWGGFDGARINRLLRPAGVALSPSWPTSKTGVLAVGTDIEVSTRDTLSETLIRSNLQSASITPAEVHATGDAVTNIMGVLPSDAPLVLRLNADIDARVITINATPENGISDEVEMAFVELEGARLSNARVADVVKHRTADAVYGALASADRVTRTISVTTQYSRWVSTGLYVPPGELVTVTVAASEVGKGYKIQVSGHRDSICGKRDVYNRVCTSPARSFALDSETLELRTAFGGALYVDVGDERPDTAFDVTVTGAAAAPFFVLGVTTNAEWQAQLLNPAPYAELFSEHVAVSVRKGTVAGTTDMDAVLRYWDQVVQHQDELGGYGAIRTYPYRMNEDVQISLGYLHSGYPTQGPFGTLDDAMTLSSILAEGSWGWYHELGHESQLRPDGAWPHAMPFGFHGATEVTVNLFSAYAYEKMGVPSRGGWDWTARNRDSLERAISAGGNYIAGGAGDKLALYLLVSFAFGWDATYKPLIREYSALYDAGNPVPSDDQDKVDDFLRRMSRLTGVSLRQYLVDGWGLTVTDSAATTSALAGLPSWMPVDANCIDDVGLPPSTSMQLDLGAGHLSLCAVTTSISAYPSVGSLRSDGGGLWTYRAGADPTTTTFAYSVQTCAGNSVTCSVTVTVADQVTVHFPSVAVGLAGVSLQLRAETFTGVSVSGFSAGSASAQHTYAVSIVPAGSGTVALAVVTGLTFTTGDGSAAETMTFTATPSDANAALASVSVTAPAGRPRLEIRVSGAGVTQVGQQQVAIAFNADINAATTISFLSNALSTIDSGEAPGWMIAYGSTAHGIIDYSTDAGSPFVAAAGWGSGRVVVVPDHQALRAAALEGASATLARNAVAWAAGAATPGASGSTWKVVALDADIVAWATPLYDASAVTRGSLRTGLQSADVFIASWLDTTLSDDDAEAIADFVAGGGGLLVADYGIGWDWWWGGLEICLGNRVLREAGIGFRSKYPKDFSGNTPAHVMHMGVDVQEAAAQHMSVDDVIAVLTDPASYTTPEVDAAAAARDRILPLLQGSDPRRSILTLLSCAGGEVFDPATNTCGATCPAGTFPDGTVCKACHPTCATCSGGGSDQCATCDTSSATPVLNGNQCEACPSGTFSRQDGTCSACDGTCATCFGPSGTECSTCEGGYEWNDDFTQCHIGCVDSDGTPPVPNVFVWNVDGVRKLVTDDCGPSSPYTAQCNDPNTETVVVGGTGTVYYVLDAWSDSRNLVVVCPGSGSP